MVTINLPAWLVIVLLALMVVSTVLSLLNIRLEWKLGKSRAGLKAMEVEDD